MALSCVGNHESDRARDLFDIQGDPEVYSANLGSGVPDQGGGGVCDECIIY